jgi:hypothetical protein
MLAKLAGSGPGTMAAQLKQRYEMETENRSRQGRKVIKP